MTTPNTDAILAEIRGVKEAQDARFDSIEREQTSLRDGMGRLADALDRQVIITQKFLSFEVRLANVEGDISDTKLDISSVKDDVSGIKTRNIRRDLILNVLAAGAGSIFTAAILKFLPAISALLHLPK